MVLDSQIQNCSWPHFLHAFVLQHGGRDIGGMQTESLREGRRESGAGPRPHHSTVHTQQSMPTLESHPVPPTPTHSPTQTSNPALPTHSTPAYRQQDQSHQGHSHCSFTSWKNRTPKYRNWQNRTADGLAPPGSPGTWALALFQAPHHLCIHISVPPRALAKACSISIRTQSD